MTTADCLRDARAYLLQHGWCQHGFHDQAGRSCLSGVLDVVAVGRFVFLQAHQRLYEVFADSVAPHHTIAEWNDQPERTLADVLALLDRAIARLDAQTPAEAREMVGV